MNNSQLAHTWAQQTKEHGHTFWNKNGVNYWNFSFDGPSLKSYKTEIARFVETNLGKVVIYTTQTYSVTTTGKHKFLHAVRQYDSYGVDCHMRDLGKTWDEIKIQVALNFISNIESLIEKLKKNKTRTASIIGNIEEHTRLLIMFRNKYFNVDTVFPHPKIGDPNILQSLFNNCESTILELYGIDVSAKLIRENQTELIRAAKEELTKQQNAKKYQVDLDNWCLGIFHQTYNFYNLPIKLRIRGENIETSHGANVPLNEGISFYERIREADIHRMDLYTRTFRTVGNFTADKIDNGIVYIGCHKIPLDEMERLYLEYKSTNTFPVLIDAIA